MTFFDIEVVVPTSCLAIDTGALTSLHSLLRAQTLKPTRVTVLVDPTDGREHPGGSVENDGFTTYFVPNAERVGSAEVWRWAEAHALCEPETNRIIVALDDVPPVRLAPEYIATSVRMLLETGSAISWLPGDGAPVAAHTLDGGATVLWHKWLRGVTSAPHAELLATAPDVYLAWWLWWKGHRILRPRGFGRVRRAPDLAPAAFAALSATGWPVERRFAKDAVMPMEKK